MNWRENLVDDVEGIGRVLTATRTIAVLGIKTEQQFDQPAYYVPAYLVQAGFEIIPVPVYFPEVRSILGREVYRKLADIPVEIDLLDVFRRPENLPEHLDDILIKRPKAVWLQQGIRHEAFAESLARAGIRIVQDRCLMVEHRQRRAGPRPQEKPA